MSDKRRRKQQKRAKRKGKGLAKKAAARNRLLQDEELADETIEALQAVLPLVDAGAPLESWLVPDQLIVDAVTASGSIVGAAQRKVARALCEGAWLEGARAALARCEAERRAELAPDAVHEDLDLDAFGEARFWLAPAMVATQALADQNALLAILYAHAANEAVRRGLLPTTLLEGDATRADLRREHESQRRARGLCRADMGPLPAPAIDIVTPPGAAWVEEARGLSRDIEKRSACIERTFARDATPERLSEIGDGLRSVAGAQRAAGASVVAFDLEAIAESLLDETLVTLGEEELPRSLATLRALYVECLHERGATPALDALEAYILERARLTASEPPPGEP